MNPMTRRHTWTRLACALSLGVAASRRAGATRAPCTGPRHPRRSAFVRAYNAGNSELDVSVGSTSLNDVASARNSSDFKFPPPAATPPRSASRSLPVQARPGQLLHPGPASPAASLAA
ncbi:alginate O-acetyltransferase AlgF [Pseudomonas aeruginosa]